MEVESWDEERDGPFSEEAMRGKLVARGYRVTRYLYAPGTVFAEHVHAVDKIDGVVSGRFLMAMNGKAAVLRAGDCVAVPRGTLHQAEVVGEVPVVSLDATRE